MWLCIWDVHSLLAQQPLRSLGISLVSIIFTGSMETLDWFKLFSQYSMQADNNNYQVSLAQSQMYLHASVQLTFHWSHYSCTCYPTYTTVLSLISLSLADPIIQIFSGTWTLLRSIEEVIDKTFGYFYQGKLCH